MKTNFLNILFVAFLGLAVVGCKDKAKEAETTDTETVAETTAEATKYSVDTAASTITWKGYKPTGSHDGTIAVESGVVTVKDGAIESGTFLIDMNSITVTDIPAEEEMNGKLVGHLKNADFFDVEKYPSAGFEVTGFENGNLSGNLKLKEKTNNITIPVTVTESGDSVTITSETFTIDRSKWDVKYGSKSFFDNLGDKFINDDIELKITVKANKS